MSAELTSAELVRYSRHLLLPEVAIAGQTRLKSARILVVGAGGLGCPAALYLAASGVGTIGIVDYDQIEISNLQRQILYTTDQVGKPKVTSAVARLKELNSDLSIEIHDTRISSTDVLQVIAEYDVVIDGTDNFATRYLLNDACMLSRKPYVYGSIFRFEGQASVFTNASGCYRCVFPKPPEAADAPNCAEAGVLGVLPAVIGSIQATEALKLVLNIGSCLKGRLLLYDALSMRFDEVQLERNSSCPSCGDRPQINLVDSAEQCLSDNISGTATTNADEIEASELGQLLHQEADRPTILDVRSSEEHAICSLPAAILIPLPELERRIIELDRGRQVIAYCKSGLRSRKAVQLLRARGYEARSLKGGILLWAEVQDPTMARY